MLRKMLAAQQEKTTEEEKSRARQRGRESERERERERERESIVRERSDYSKLVDKWCPRPSKSGTLDAHEEKALKIEPANEKKKKLPARALEINQAVQHIM